MVRRGKGVTHTHPVGDAIVTVLNVGAAKRTAEQLQQVFADVPLSDLEAAVPTSTDWSFNPLLISAAGETILVDTGFAFAKGGPMIATSDALAEAGVAADDVSIVLITHAHGDHVGGLLAGGAPAFTNARLIISAAERLSPLQETAMAAMDAYGDRVVALEKDGAVVDAQGVTVRLIPAPGHTPGHSAVLIASGGEELIALVDTLHSEVQFAKPDWSPRFDADTSVSVRTRKRLLGWASDENKTVHFFHLGFPGIGTVTRDGDAFRWRPE